METQQMERQSTVRRIISGGQTGVDRGGLDAAMEFGLQHGGWCPAGRRAEDGRIPRRYRLKSTRSPQYKVRTQQNVIDSDGTLILFRHELSGGTLLTRQFCTQHQKPCWQVDLTTVTGEGVKRIVSDVVAWIAEHNIRTLNVAGPRESQNQGIAIHAKVFLLQVLEAV
ncbi:MAG: putative molybdenum carrier protein [Planctomycetales bacterium]